MSKYVHTSYVLKCNFCLSISVFQVCLLSTCHAALRKMPKFWPCFQLICSAGRCTNVLVLICLYIVLRCPQQESPACSFSSVEPLQVTFEHIPFLHHGDFHLCLMCALVLSCIPQEFDGKCHHTPSLKLSVEFAAQQISPLKHPGRGLEQIYVCMCESLSGYVLSFRFLKLKQHVCETSSKVLCATPEYLLPCAYCQASRKCLH